MTPREMESCRHYRGVGTQLLVSKRKRERSRSPDNTPPVKRFAGDVGKVIDHCEPLVQLARCTFDSSLLFLYADNTRPEVGVKQRMESPIIGLKYFNNWVKSVLITRFAHPALTSSPVSQSSGPGRGRGKVLDLGCGKGGDLTKWAKAQVKELVCAGEWSLVSPLLTVHLADGTPISVDIADISVTQARERWQGMPIPRFDAAFAAIDCYTEPLSKAFPPERLAQPFDVVSMQFCMHYAFETSQKARCMLRNVSQYLRKGGVFLGTIPNADQLLYALSFAQLSAERITPLSENG